VAHYLHQEIDEKRRQMQQQLDLRDRQVIEANRAKANLLVPSLCNALFRLYLTSTISNTNYSVDVIVFLMR